MYQTSFIGAPTKCLPQFEEIKKLNSEYKNADVNAERRGCDCLEQSKIAHMGMMQL